MRICLVGASGTGKTTLCFWAHNNLNLPFLTTSTKGLWDKYKIRKHEDIISRTAKNPEWGYEFQLAVMDYRIKLLRNNEHYITDRSPVCNLVYFLMQVSPFVSYARTLDYIERCKEAMQYVDGLIHIPYNRQMGLEDDGKRVNSPIFQECSQLYYQYVMDNHLHVNFTYSPNPDAPQDAGKPGLILVTDHFAERTKLTTQWIEKLSH